MIRLALIDADKARCEAIALRLRGVILAPVESCDCVAYLNPPNDSELLKSQKPTLVLAGGGLSSAVLNALAEANAPSTIANPDRYLPSRRLIHQHLVDKKLGHAGLVRLHRWEPADRASPLLCDLDLVSWYFGTSPNLVYAVANKSTLIHLGYPGGGMALIDRQVSGHGNRYSYLSVIGSAGAAYADDHHNAQVRIGAPSATLIPTDEGVVQWSMLLQEFADELGKRPADAQSMKHWQQLLAVAEAVQESLRTKQAVVLKGAS